MKGKEQKNVAKINKEIHEKEGNHDEEEKRPKSNKERSTKKDSNEAERKERKATLRKRKISITEEDGEGEKDKTKTCRKNRAKTTEKAGHKTKRIKRNTNEEEEEQETGKEVQSKGKEDNKETKKEKKKEKEEEEDEDEQENGMSYVQRKRRVNVMASLYGIFHLSSFSTLINMLLPYSTQAMEVTFAISDIKKDILKDDVKYVIESLCACGFKQLSETIVCKRNLDNIKELIFACTKLLKLYKKEDDLESTFFWDTPHGGSFKRALDVSYLYQISRNETLDVSCRLRTPTEEFWTSEDFNDGEVRLHYDDKELNTTCPGQFIGSIAGTDELRTFLWGSDNPGATQKHAFFAKSMREGFGKIHEIKEFRDLPVTPRSNFHAIEDTHMAYAMSVTAITAELVHRGAIKKSKLIENIEKQFPVSNAEWHFWARRSMIRGNIEARMYLFWPNEWIQKGWDKMKFWSHILGSKIIDALRDRTILNSYHATLNFAKRAGWRVAGNKPGVRSGTIELELCALEQCNKKCRKGSKHVSMIFESYYRLKTVRDSLTYEEQGAYLRARKTFWEPPGERFDRIRFVL